MAYKPEDVIKRINETYSPRPEKIEVWYELDDDTFRSLVKFKKGDNEVYLSQWDVNDLECMNEITLTEKTFQMLYTFTSHHQLYSQKN